MITIVQRVLAEAEIARSLRPALIQRVLEITVIRRTAGGSIPVLDFDPADFDTVEDFE